MSRNDGFLTRAATSSAQERRQREAEKQAQKRENRRVLEPAESLIFTEIEKQKNIARSRLLELVDENSRDDNLHGVLFGVRQSLKDLEQLQMRLRNILKQAPDKQAESFDE